MEGAGQPRVCGGVGFSHWLVGQTKLQSKSKNKKTCFS